MSKINVFKSFNENNDLNHWLSGLKLLTLIFIAEK